MPVKRGTYRGRPYVKRRVLWIQPSEELTRRGRPELFTYIYECGHWSYRSYSPETGVAYAFQMAVLELEKNMEKFHISKFCFDCGANKPLNYYCKMALGRLPWRVFTIVPEIEELWNTMKGPEFEPPRSPTMGAL